jgi:hypothetical protein
MQIEQLHGLAFGIGTLDRDTEPLYSIRMSLRRRSVQSAWFLVRRNVMGATKVRHQFPGQQPSVVNNGGVSAGAQSGSRVEKIGPPEAHEPTNLPGTAHVATAQSLELFNKQDGNQPCENGPQGKLGADVESIERAALALPPAAPINLRGRPATLTPQRLEQLCQLLSLGFSRAQAAAYLGVDRSTVTKAANRDPELKAELQRAEEVSDLQPQLTVIAEARKNWRAAAWLLQFKAKHHPRKPTEADKEELHQERLADLHRETEAIVMMGGKKS